MFLRKFTVAAAGLVTGLLATTVAAFANPQPWQMGFQEAVTPVMERIEDFHHLLLIIIVVICVFVAALILWIMVRYNTRANPVPSKTAHNTVIEVVWTIVPVIILVIVAIPSFKLLYYEAAIPTPDVKIKAIGKQWFWSYEYPAANIVYDSLGLSDADNVKQGKPRLLGVDNPIYVPVNKVVELETTGADVIHSWAVPAFGVKIDSIPGRLNHSWFKATKEGVYYGQCSELCGVRHAYMPIEVHVVSQAAYDAWLAAAKKKFAAIQPETNVAQLAK